MVVDCPIVITSIGDTLFQTRQDQEWGIIFQASLLQGWHWVLFCIGMAYIVTTSTKWIWIILSNGWLLSGNRSMFGMIRYQGKGGRKKTVSEKDGTGSVLVTRVCLSQLTYWGCTYVVLSPFKCRQLLAYHEVLDPGETPLKIKLLHELRKVNLLWWCGDDNVDRVGNVTLILGRRNFFFNILRSVMTMLLLESNKL